jgi:hypothetical protein
LWSVALVALALAVLVVAKLWSATFLRIIAGTLAFAVLIAIGAGGYYGYSYFENLRRIEERQALDERAEALFSKTVEADSVFACVDGSPVPAMQEACERSLFAEPARVAAAVAIVTQRLAFLDDAVTFSDARDPDYGKRIEAMRNSVESDPYGLVAFVLSVEHRCTLESCARFALLRDPAHVKENMRTRRFEAYMAKYAATWRGPDQPEGAPKIGTSTSPLVTISAEPNPVPAEGDAKEPAASPAESSAAIEIPAAAMAPVITPPTDANFAAQPAEANSEPKAAAATAPAKGKAAPAKSASAPEKSAPRPAAPAKSKAKDSAAQKSSEPVAGLPRVVPSEYVRDQEERPASPEQSSTQQPGAPTQITPLQQNFNNR